MAAAVTAVDDTPGTLAVQNIQAWIKFGEALLVGDVHTLAEAAQTLHLLMDIERQPTPPDLGEAMATNRIAWWQKTALLLAKQVMVWPLFQFGLFCCDSHPVFADGPPRALVNVDSFSDHRWGGP